MLVGLTEWKYNEDKQKRYISEVNGLYGIS